MTWIDNTFQFENQTRQSRNTISESNEAQAKDYNVRLHFKLTQKFSHEVEVQNPVKEEKHRKIKNTSKLWKESK